MPILDGNEKTYEIHSSNLTEYELDVQETLALNKSFLLLSFFTDYIWVAANGWEKLKLLRTITDSNDGMNSPLWG